MTPIHSLAITKRHVVNYFQWSKEEFEEILMILDIQKDRIKDMRFIITGINIRMNLNEEGGQTIWYFHIDIIPRWKWDTTKSKCRLGGLISEKQKYLLI